MEEIQPKQNMTVSRSFGRPVTTLQEMEEAVACYAARAGKKLRRQKSVAGGIYVYLRTNSFRNEPQYSNACSLPLHVPTNHDSRMISVALTAVRRIFREGFRYKKAGVILMDLQKQSDMYAQGDLFGNSIREHRGDALMTALDKINRTCGRDTLYFASQGIGREWWLRADLRSPRYTTRWADLPRVQAG